MDEWKRSGEEQHVLLPSERESGIQTEGEVGKAKERTLLAHLSLPRLYVTDPLTSLHTGRKKVHNKVTGKVRARVLMI